MKLSKLQRPEVEVEFVGLKGFFEAVIKILRFGITKANVGRYRFWIIPKYRFKKVLKIEEIEVGVEWA